MSDEKQPTIFDVKERLQAWMESIADQLDDGETVRQAKERTTGQMPDDLWAGLAWIINFHARTGDMQSIYDLMLLLTNMGYLEGRKSMLQ
jgi:hypothetical protein